MRATHWICDLAWSLLCILNFENFWIFFEHFDKLGNFIRKHNFLRHVVITTKQTESENPNPDGCSLRQLSQEGRNVRIERQTIYTGLPASSTTHCLPQKPGRRTRNMWNIQNTTQCKIEFTYASHCVSKNMTPHRMLKKCLLIAQMNRQTGQVKIWRRHKS